MSFASETKNELVSTVVSDCCCKAELSALLQLNGVVTISSEGVRLEFQTQNATIARRVVKLIRQLYDVKLEVLTRRMMRLNKKNVYILRITQYARMIVSDLGLLGVVGVPVELVENSCCKRAYLRGSFLATGSVNNPERSAYHLEVYANDEPLIEGIRELMNGFELNARTIPRKKGYIAYLKEAEKISDFLRIIQANNAVLDFEDIRIYRDMNNSVNRIRNCEVANLNRSWEASNMQLDNIQLLEDVIGLDILDEKLVEVAELRKQYPEATLSELSELYEETYQQPISKSGLNHRFRKINQMADEIRENQASE